MERIIGRETEKQILEDCLNSEKPEFLVIYGRRRIGKTHLIRNYFEDRFAFYATGVFGKKNADQLTAFYISLQEFGDDSNSHPKNWFEAFARLKKILTHSDVRKDVRTGKKIIFMDEVPWMCSPKSDFKSALDHFWNSWASLQNDIVLIVCGSATSWVLNNLLYDKGGFFHRVTRKIHLGPLSLKECEEFLEYKEIPITRHQIVEYYMFFGGVPYYYTLLNRRLSLAQNINDLFFSKHGMLNDELLFLFQSLFKKPEHHIKLIRLLAEKKEGMTREELAQETPDIVGGSLDRALKELMECDFIRKYNNFTMKSKGSVYQIIDPMLLFYLEFVENGKHKDWLSFVGSNKYNSWCGNAFEIVCLLHVDKIKYLLGISGVYSEEFSWRSKKKAEGTQIDLLIDRRDKTITICEMKYHSQPFEITSTNSNQLAHKRQVFLEETKTKKTVNIILLTSYGITKNSVRHEIINDFTEEQLFI